MGTSSPEAWQATVRERLDGLTVKRASAGRPSLRALSAHLDMPVHSRSKTCFVDAILDRAAAEANLADVLWQAASSETDVPWATRVWAQLRRLVAEGHASWQERVQDLFRTLPIKGAR